MLICFIILYLLITIGVGWYASKNVKTSKDFTIAGRQMPTYVVASGLFATWFGSETVMGASSEFVDNGLLGVIEDPFGAALCLLLIGMFFSRPLYKLNILTFSDYFRIRYDNKVEWISAIFMIPSYFSWIAAQLVALAIVLQSIANVPFVWGILICASVVLFYTYVGGMWSVAITDTIQTVIIVIGLLLLMLEMLYEVGGTEKILMNTPKDFFRFTPKDNSFNSWIGYFAAWITIGWGSIPQQDVFQRTLSAKNADVAVRSAYWSALMYLSVASMPLVIALCGSILYPDIKNGDSQMLIPFLVLKHTSLGMQILFFGALLSAILSTCSGAILAPATVLGENLIKPLYGHKISDKQLLKTMRMSSIAITALSVTLSLYKAEIYELVGESSALSLVALFIPLVAGLYWKKANALGAILSMTLGTSVWTLFEFYESEIPSMIWGLLASISGMILGSLIKKN
ncbi:Na+/solute symporter [Emticicia oligotrophica DSM 17448]|uniref:Na+/solute symporter n=1 Tax=Emticicia oligotrophica (strain DSM 17448 / CIP 109782 / MTCC 6937 / GPTSA100-15) TaxID=929562 RepID=A0ABM5N6E9_EMTOG|nr:sodium:solute symporter family protein [Emticicia oligotrophica]AFK05021.1 Na+/solute symporter [Emticicia oligotrophica DSM 17448]